MSCPPAESPPPERLSIAHLMLWTLGSAISLGLYRAITLAQRPDDRLTVVSQVFALIYCLPAGARIGGVLLFAWKTLKGDRSFPTQPGHWLLVVEGFSALLSWSGRAAAVFFAADQAQNFSLWPVSQVPNCVVTAVAYVVALRYLSSESRLWRVALWVLFFEHAVMGLTFGAMAINALNSSFAGYLGPWGFLMQFYSMQFACWPSVLVVILPIAGLTDPHRSRRDFLHWAGLIAVFATALLNICARWIVRFFI